MGGEDDGDAALAQLRGPAPTCRGAARRRRRRSARRGTGCRARGDSALAIITRRFMPPDSSMIFALRLSQSDRSLQHLLDMRRVGRLAEQAAAEADRRPAPSRTRRCAAPAAPGRSSRARGAIVAADVVAVDGDRARARRDDAADDADQRRLAGAVGAEQSEDLALLDLEVDRLQRLERRCIGLGQALDGDDRSIALIRPAAIGGGLRPRSSARGRGGAASARWRRRTGRWPG